MCLDLLVFFKSMLYQMPCITASTMGSPNKTLITMHCCSRKRVYHVVCIYTKQQHTTERRHGGTKQLAHAECRRASDSAAAQPIATCSFAQDNTSKANQHTMARRHLLASGQFVAPYGEKTSIIHAGISSPPGQSAPHASAKHCALGSCTPAPRAFKATAPSKHACQRFMHTSYSGTKHRRDSSWICQEQQYDEYKMQRGSIGNHQYIILSMFYLVIYKRRRSERLHS